MLEELSYLSAKNETGNRYDQGVEVNKALDMLKFSPKEASGRVEKLLLSAIANWQAKNEGARIEESNLVVKEAYVDAVQDA